MAAGNLPHALMLIATFAQASNKRSLEAAVEAAAEFLNSKGKAALVAGFQLRPGHAQDAFLKLADASGYPVAGELSSKQLISLHLHPVVV